MKTEYSFKNPVNWLYGFLVAVLLVCTSCSSGPSADDREQIFRKLLVQTYGAFEASDESTIYDALVVSVDDEFLQTLYNQFSESLKIKEAEGKKAQVHRVNIIEVKQLRNDSSDSFTVEAIWEVTGEIVHFDHRHEQRVQYRGNFEVSHQSDGWRLTDGSILQQRRAAGSWEKL